MIFSRAHACSVIVCSLEGCQKVAGGRSEAETTGNEPLKKSTLKGCEIGLKWAQRFSVSTITSYFHRRIVARLFAPSGVLNCIPIWEELFAE